VTERRPDQDFAICFREDDLTLTDRGFIQWQRGRRRSFALLVSPDDLLPLRPRNRSTAWNV
jgi:hypothetical protein